MEGTFWCCYNTRTKVFDYTTIRRLRRDAIKEFVRDIDMTWKRSKEKYGWDAVKVTLTINHVLGESI